MPVKKITGSNAAPSGLFGGSVAGNGGSLAVGALGPSASVKSQHGAIHVFTRGGPSWNGPAGCTASDGDTAFASARWARVGVNYTQDKAYAFQRFPPYVPPRWYRRCGICRFYSGTGQPTCSIVPCGHRRRT